MFDSADGCVLVFEAQRGTNYGAKMRISLSRWLMFEDQPPSDQNGARVAVSVVLPRSHTSTINPAGASVTCDDFLSLGDLRALQKQLALSAGMQTVSIEGLSHAFQMKAEHIAAHGRMRTQIVGQIAEPPMQCDNWPDQWRWATAAPMHESAYQCSFGLFIDPECMTLASVDLERFLASL